MEKHLIKQSKKYGFDYAILRLPGVVGYKSNHNFLSENIKRIKLNKEIFISNPNLLFNNAIHVKNLAMIIFQSLNKKNEESIYNLGSKKKIKLKRVFDLIYKNFKKKA